jgi:hypothetical protein
MNEINQELLLLQKLKEKLNYDKNTGLFTWVNCGRPKLNGKVAGTVSKRGYIHLHIHPYIYKGHRLAWLFEYGKWPEYGIDHINGNKTDNRIENLRDIPQRHNNCNTPAHREGKLPGYMLVTLADGTKVYRARIITGKKTKYLGNFYTEKEANLAYLKAREELFASKKEVKELYASNTER